MRLTLTEPFLPGGVRLQIILIIKEQIGLNVCLSWLLQEVELVRPGVGINALRMWRCAHVPVAGCLQREKTFPERSLMRRPILPERAAPCPERRQAFFVGNRILDDDGLDFLGVANGHPHSDRPTVIVKVKGITV